jgi:hypothetical protein
VDEDCTGNRLCYEELCTWIKKDMGLLDVSLSPPVEGAVLVVNEEPPVELPWVGMLPIGLHKFRIEAEHHAPLELNGTIAARARTQLILALQPDPLSPATPSPQGDGQEDEEDAAAMDTVYWPPVEGTRHTFYAAGIFHGSGGITMWSNSERPTQFTTLGGVELGVGVEGPSAGFDFGLSVKYGSFLVLSIPGEDDPLLQRNLLVLSVMPRLLFPFALGDWYAGFELEAGIAVSTLNYFYGALRGHVSYAFTSWLELRAALLGVDWMQEATGKAVFVAYNANLALVFRLPP